MSRYSVMVTECSIMHTLILASQSVKALDASSGVSDRRGRALE